jgi:DNA-binding HxlR family transcriptional regulator
VIHSGLKSLRYYTCHFSSIVPKTSKNEHVNDLTFLDGPTRVMKNLVQMPGVTKAVLSDVLRELESRGVLQFG